MTHIASRHNVKVCEWRKLRRPEVARAAGRVIIEGAHAVLQALGSGRRLRALLICPEMARPDLVRLALQRAGPEAPVYELSGEAFASLSVRDGPSGIAAVIELGVGELADLVPGRGDLLLGLWRVENPGNLGTIVRTANSFGVRAVVLVDRCTNPYSPVAAKASMGAIFHTPLLSCRDLAGLRSWCDRFGLALVATSARGAVPCAQWAPTGPLVLLFGREGGGLPADALALCDYTVCIPMQGTSSSLNLATAVGILTFAATAGPRQAASEGA